MHSHHYRSVHQSPFLLAVQEVETLLPQLVLEAGLAKLGLHS
jgi:hypothetical protein